MPQRAWPTRPPPRYAQAYTSTTCHGAYGEKQPPGQPRIGGRDFYELLSLMASFRSAERFHPVMTMLMLSLDEVAMAEIAEYFATIDPARLAPIGAYGVRY